MKTSVQVLAGAVSGALLAILLPANSIILKMISGLSENVLSIGKYIILPLILFSSIISITQLHRERVLFKNSLKVIGLSALLTLALVILGVIASLIYSPGQIPVVIDGIQNVEVPTFGELIRLSFPSNIFSIFQGEISNSNNQLVPFFALALVLGIFFTKNSREEIEPTFNLVDSLSRLFYKINEYFYKISYIWVALLTAAYVSTLRNITDYSLFSSLTIMLVIITLVVVFIIYPIVFYKFCDKKNIFKYLFAEFPSVVNAVITGDQFFTTSAIILTQKNDFKIKRKSSGFNIPFLTLFSKAGTAMVTVISFIVILRSYSSLDITASQILWVGIVSFLVSFCLPTKTFGSSVASLFLMCSLYGYGGIEDSYIILSPIFPILGSIATVINTVTIILINTIMDPERRS